MSDAVMGESSSYRDSIKFYERMSHLQGELKNYESQQFQLEEEFQTLWTQGISLPSSEPMPTMSTMPTTSAQSVHFAQLGHLSNSNKSQLLANPNNPNYYGKNDEVNRRRARNQAILDKLQELETNASIFAARSERLKMMRNEYETLVRKCASNRKWGSSVPNGLSSYCKSQTSVTQTPKRPSGITVTSTGVNTDVTGPIKPLSLHVVSSRENDPQINIEHGLSAMEMYPEMGRHSEKREKDSINLSHGHNTNSIFLQDEPSFITKQGQLLPKEIRRPTFFDISTTTESQSDLLQDSKLNHHQNQHQADNMDETSADTTSLSVLMPKFRLSNILPNVTTDGSLSDSTSIKYPPINTRISFINTTQLPASSLTSVTSGTNGVAVDSGESKSILKEKRIISFAQDGGKSVDQNQNQDQNQDQLNEVEETSARSDSTSHSVGDSALDLDSACNKTPDSLPRDDSELLHITEVDEEEYNESKIIQSKIEDQQDHQDRSGEFSEPKASELINERGTGRSQIQENWDNSSSSNLLSMAQKEIETLNDEEVNIRDKDHLQNSSIFGKAFDKAITPSIRKLGDVAVNNGRNVDVYYNQDDDHVSSLRKNSEENEDHRQASFLSNAFLVGSPSSSQMEKVDSENSTESKSTSRHVKLHGDRDSSSENEMNKETAKSLQSKPYGELLSQSQRPNLNKTGGTGDKQRQGGSGTGSSSRIKATGNVRKKVHLKLDYDDSESDQSDKGLVLSTTKATIDKPSTPDIKSNSRQPTQKELDDDFADFYI